MSFDPENAASDLRRAIEEHRGRFRGLGIALVVIGLLAIVFPLVASIAAKLMIGWLLLLAGAVTLWHAFQARSWSSALMSGLVGLLQLAAGVYLAFFPLTGLIGLTLLMGLLFAVQGVLELLIAFRHRPEANWLWLALSGAASLIVAVLLILGLPGTALWALGLLLGINLLTSGISFLALSRSV